MESDACAWSLLGYMFGASTPISKSDNEALMRVLEGPGKWNATLTPLVRDLLDEAVTGDEWLASYKPTMPKLRGFVATMRTASLGIRNKDVRVFLAPIIATYEKQIVQLELLASSIQSGDSALQGRARDSLSQLGNSKAEMMKVGLDRLIDLGYGKEVNAMLAAKAKRLAQQMGG
jgi:hypothetical protein